MAPNNNSAKLIAYAILIALVIVLPFVLPSYYVYLLSLALISIIATLSFRFITLIGEWSFAHAAFMGVGAYSSGLLITRLDWPFWLAAPLAILITAAIAGMISFPLMRTKFFFFFLASFAIGEAIRYLWLMFPRLFGGHQGLVNIPRPEPFTTLVPYYFLILMVTLLCAGLMYWLEKSSFGYIVKSCGQNESLAQHVGISSRQYKVITFIIGSSFAGVAGILLAHMTQAVAPPQFGWDFMLFIFIYLMVGGKDSYAGPIVGVLVLTVIAELLRGLQMWVPLVYGLMLITILLLLPGGLVSLFPGMERRMPAKSLSSVMKAFTGKGRGSAS
ncbi:MAG: branched-chain amino acid ABC transporter permease [Chloroflexi bacterium]|nr:branched-chain amino acid ABC transporter permease [Chloroflexota bacterium]